MNETDYISGSRAAWLSMLHTCLRELGVDDPVAGQARWVSEREQTVAMLRQVCERYGDNDWPDTLHLADVVDKHLGKYLAADTLNRSRFTDIEGDYSHATTGGYAHAVTAGDCVRASTSGVSAVSVAIGCGSVAKAAIGGFIVLAQYDGTEVVAIKTAQVGRDGIKPDTWYRLSSTGDFVETTV